MFKLSRHLAFMALASMGCVAGAIVARDFISTDQAVGVAMNGGHNDYVGRVYFTGGNKSTTPAAIISNNRALIFTKNPVSIESIEMEAPNYEYVASQGNTVAKYIKSQYKVIGTKELRKFTNGTLVCCEIEGTFKDATPLLINNASDEAKSNSDDQFSSSYGWGYSSNNTAKATNNGTTLEYKHTYYGAMPCKDAYILGYGANYDYTTRQAIVDENSDALKCVEACVFSSAQDSTRLFCPFDNHGVTTYHGQPSVDHKRMLGWVGPDDLGALLVNTVTTTEVGPEIDPDTLREKVKIIDQKQYLIGLACEAGSEDIKDKQKPFYDRLSVFLRLSAIYNDCNLANIATMAIPRGYTPVGGQAAPSPILTPLPRVPSTPYSRPPQRPTPYTPSTPSFPATPASPLNNSDIINALFGLLSTPPTNPHNFNIPRGYNPTPQPDRTPSYTPQRQSIQIAYENGEPTDKDCFLIDPYIVLTTRLSRELGGAVRVGNGIHTIKNIQKVGNQMKLVYLTQPALNAKCVPIFRGADPFSAAEKMNAHFNNYGNSFYVIEARDQDPDMPWLFGNKKVLYLVGLTYTEPELQFTEEQRSKIDALIIDDALDTR